MTWRGGIGGAERWRHEYPRRRTSVIVGMSCDVMRATTNQMRRNILSVGMREGEIESGIEIDVIRDILQGRVERRI